MRQGDTAAAKQLLSRSLQSLSRHKHIEVILQYAGTEYDKGSQDRGRVVFEELLGSYPKRTDLWHVYIDKEIKAGHVDQARQLLDRMLGLRLNVKNIKTVFKKYLDLEKRHGDERSQAEVREKAKAYASSMM